MDTAETLYLMSVILSVIIAFLFVRYLYWGLKARLTYWRKIPGLSIVKVRAEAQKNEMAVPHFSIMIPARDEADVIGLTVDHMAGLNYPKDHYEIVVITDGKEYRAKDPGGAKLTTQDVVEAKIKELAKNPDAPALKHIVVPCDFDGRVGGVCLGEDVPSTKARALNYGLGYIDGKTVLCSFYDAESRPEKDALLYVAARWVMTRGKQKLWQGPVFQVRNFFQLGAMSKLVALYQALSHEWNYPLLMRSLPFLGGTNLHMERKLLISVGGYDPKALSEDLELGVRIYMETEEWPEYIPIVSTEQTPARYRAYFRQRLRWGSGHLQVYDKLQNAVEYPERLRLPILHKLFWKGQAQWYIYQGLVLIPLVIIVWGIFAGLDSSLVPVPVVGMLQTMVPIYYGFTFYLYFRYHRYINFAGAPTGIHRFLAVMQLLVLFVAGFFICAPFTTALILRAAHREPQVWVKTPRTQEVQAKASQI